MARGQADFRTAKPSTTAVSRQSLPPKKVPGRGHVCLGAVGDNDLADAQSADGCWQAREISSLHSGNSVRITAPLARLTGRDEGSGVKDWWKREVSGSWAGMDWFDATVEMCGKAERPQCVRRRHGNVESENAESKQRLAERRVPTLATNPHGLVTARLLACAI